MAKKLIEATRNKVTRPFNVPKLLDYDESVNARDKQILMAKSRSAYSNNPLVRSVIQGKAMFATKNAWRYQPASADADWKRDATAYFEKFARVATVSGSDFSTLIYQACISIDVNGDFFAVLTESRDGFPQLQVIPPHRVATRDNAEKIVSGKYRGYKVISGVIVNSFNRPVAYSVLADEPAKDRIIDARDMIHIFDAETVESVRGIPLVSHVLNSLEDLEASKNAELASMRIHSSTSLIETLGAEDDTAGFLGGTSATVPLYEEFRDGQIRVFRSQNSELKGFESNRPSPNYQTFRNKLIQEIVISLGWSTSLLDGGDKSSVENRLNIRVAEISVSDRIALLSPHIKRIAFWVLSKGIQRGELSPAPEYWNMTFSRPPFISADISRIENSTRENLKLGITTLTQICEAEGRDLETHLRELAHEKKLKAQIGAEFGVSFDN